MPPNPSLSSLHGSAWIEEVVGFCFGVWIEGVVSIDRRVDQSVGLVVRGSERGSKESWSDLVDLGFFFFFFFFFYSGLWSNLAMVCEFFFSFFSCCGWW